MLLSVPTYHPPGAAHKSNNERHVPKKLYFLFNCINLNAARERNPCSYQDVYE